MSAHADAHGPERLWTPHRIAYIRGDDKPADDSEGQCPFCRIPASAESDQQLVVAGAGDVVAMLNLYPYAPGHLMVLPRRHIADYTQTTDAEARAMAELVEQAIATLRLVSGAAGFNVGMNQGVIAGAGISAHLHQHVVPRWSDDQEHVPVVGGDAMPDLLARTADLLRSRWVGA